MLKLVTPSPEYLDSVLKSLHEYEHDDTAFCTIGNVELMLKYLPDEFSQYLQIVEGEQNGTGLPQGHVNSSTFWLMDDDEYIGSFSLRHGLTPSLLQEGGNVAYEILPSKRSKGYAKQGLKLVLKEALRLGMDKVLVTCHEDNIASYKVMHSVMLEMGGNEVPLSKTDNHLNHRVWIVTQKRQNGTIRPLSLAIIKKEGKVLAYKGYDEKKDEYFYRLPGGGIEFGERAEDTLKRELKEELGLDININAQLGVLENLFTFNNKKGHEIAFLFEASLSEEDYKKDTFAMIEPEYEGMYAEFVKVAEDVKIYPEEAVRYLK